jgi:hypothetical protein
MLLCLPAVAQALPIVLYNGSASSPPNTSPTLQGWSLGTVNVTGTAVETSIVGGVTLDTTSGLIRSGYGILSPLPLDRTVSYSLTFDLQLNSESHSSNDRAGLSVVVIGSDLQGIELGFWTGDIWAQNLGFTHGEDAAYNATQRTIYTLAIGGGGYQLIAGGNVLLSGALRNYSASGAPYNVSNFIFVGDDTFSAGASSSFFEASVASPEPASAWLGLAALVLVSVRWRGRPRRAVCHRRWRLAVDLAVRV